jgi:hypothetical protein
VFTRRRKVAVNCFEVVGSFSNPGHF